MFLCALKIIEKNYVYVLHVYIYFYSWKIFFVSHRNDRKRINKESQLHRKSPASWESEEPQQPLLHTQGWTPGHGRHTSSTK